jgi:hypothetical protein
MTCRSLARRAQIASSPSGNPGCSKVNQFVARKWPAHFFEQA